MYTVYVLRDTTGKLYKGMTNDLSRRLAEHGRGSTKTTRNMDNLAVVYTKEFLTRQEARAHEVCLKSAAGRRFIGKILL